MKPQKIIIPGGNGYLGRFLTSHFAGRGHEVVVLTREKTGMGGLVDASPRRAVENPNAAPEFTPINSGGAPLATRRDEGAASTLKTSPPRGRNIRSVHWDGETPGAWMAELENAAAVINLAGRSVNCRYNRRNKQAIYDSRLKSTAVLGQAIAACVHPPKVWINSSTATIYRHAEDREMDEATGEIGHGFSVDVAKKWEAALNEANTPPTRKVAARIGMVMGLGEDYVFSMLHRLVRFKLGGTLGNGRQFVSWIHWQDCIRAIEWIMENDALNGPVNVTSPNPLTNREFMQILREADHQSVGFPAPAWMLTIGAVFLRTETELVLKSRRVIPTRLLASGFIFNHPHWEGAVRDLLAQPMHPLLKQPVPAHS